MIHNDKDDNDDYEGDCDDVSSKDKTLTTMMMVIGYDDDNDNNYDCDDELCVVLGTLLQ